MKILDTSYDRMDRHFYVVEAKVSAEEGVTRLNRSANRDGTIVFNYYTETGSWLIW